MLLVVVVHWRGEPSENTHFTPLHWQTGTDEFQEDKRRLSLVPWREGLIFETRSFTSEEVAERDVAQWERRKSLKKKKT